MLQFLVGSMAVVMAYLIALVVSFGVKKFAPNFFPKELNTKFDTFVFNPLICAMIMVVFTCLGFIGIKLICLLGWAILKVI